MIRSAMQKDAAAIGRVYCEGWKAAYQGLMPDFFLNALTPHYSTPHDDIYGPTGDR